MKEYTHKYFLEAMYMKKVCIVSDVIGNRDVIYNGKNGFVCHGVKEFIHAVKAAQTSDSKELTQQAFDDIIKSYNTNVMSERYNQIYKKTLEGIEKTVEKVAS